MGRLLKAALTLGALAFALPLAAQPFDVTLDLRAVDASARTSFLNGGLGKLRFDDQHDGLRLGELRIGYRQDAGPSWHFAGEAVAWGDNDRNVLDLTELYAAWRPMPDSAWRQEVKIGAFYPAISLENRMRGWRSPYTLSPSAINTWIGEELRTIGVEYGTKWLGAHSGHKLTLGMNGAVFGWNDPAGVVMALRGWALHDRQTTLFGRLGEPGTNFVDGRTLFYTDIDGRAGWYAGPTLKYGGWLEVRALRYDNRGNTAKSAPAINDVAWLTRFDSAGVRITPNDQWTFIWQRLYGNTYACDCHPDYAWHFDADFLLASWTRGHHRLSARYDRFDMHQTVPDLVTSPDGSSDLGHALTAAWTWQVKRRLALTAEWLHVDSTDRWREYLGVNGEPWRAAERELQLALRYELVPAAGSGDN